MSPEIKDRARNVAAITSGIIALSGIAAELVRAGIAHKGEPSKEKPQEKKWESIDLQNFNSGDSRIVYTSNSPQLI